MPHIKVKRVQFLKVLTALLTTCLYAVYAHGQILGTPFVDAYSKTSYGYGTQNWDIEQLENGKLFFANNEGLLEFNGSQWHLFPLPNRTILRSIAIYNGHIYAGGQNEFGRFEADQQQKWRYRSLVELIPQTHRDFEDAWDMQLLEDRIYFRASEKLFMFEDSSCTVITEVPIQFLDCSGGRIYVQSREGLVYQLNDGQLQPLPGSGILRGTEVRKILATKAGLLIATRKQGIFLATADTIEKWANAGENRFPNQFINTLDLLANGDIVIGTGFRGVIVIDQTGRFRYQVSTEDGLSDNRVICTFLDRQQNLWLGSDNGISMVRTNSPFTRIYPDGDLEGAGYDVAVLGNKIYFGTSSGLFFTNWDEQSVTNEFELVGGTTGQVWGLDVIDRRLLLSHNDGAFLINGDRADPFFTETGAWLFQEDRMNDDLIFSGNYKGITIFDRRSLAPLYSIPGLAESSRFIVQDQRGHYWMSHPYRGIFRVEHPHDPVQRSVRFMGPDAGLPSTLHNHVFQINGEILVCAERGIFTFDEEQRQFVHYAPLEDYLGADVKVRRLFESPGGDIWFITEQEVGVLEITEVGLEREITKRVFPELSRLMNGGWEQIYPLNKEQVFISTISGFLHYRAEQKAVAVPPFQVIFEELYINKDSLLYLHGMNGNLILQPQQNSLRFNVAATEYVNNAGMQFQYMLEGFEEEWSPPTELRSKEYTNLPPGTYVLSIRAIDPDGKQSAPRQLAFEIRYPWYRTMPAIVIYLLALSVVTFLLFRRSRRKFAALEQQVETTVKQSKAEIQRLETEKIQAELQHKKRELVSATLHLVKKSDTLAEITEQISEIRKQSADPKVSRQLQKLIHSLKQDEVLDDGWEQVMFHFNELNEGFFDRLKQQYADLTPKDLKLCAYLKMNLTSKEMATLMNVSLRGVEASRYRLRKKLQLDSEDNLTEFLMGF